MPYQYLETIAFDAMVVLVVAFLIPLSVLLLRSGKTTGRVAGLVLLSFSCLYVGGFEHWRIHSPEITYGGLRAALVDPAARALSEAILASGMRRMK